MSFVDRFNASLDVKVDPKKEAQKGLGIIPNTLDTDIGTATPEVQEPTGPNKPQPQPVQEPLSPEDEARKDELAQGIISQQIDPISNQATQNYVAEDPNTWNPEDTQKGFIAKTGTSMLRGFGSQVIGGTGDILQMANLIVGADISDGNMASRALQEAGQGIADENQTYTSKAFREQMETNAWNIKTAMHPDFWSTAVAEGIPMLVEFILLSKGGSALVRGGAKKALANVAKKQGRNVVEDVAGKSARAGGKDVLAKGGGNLSSIVLETGELTELGSGMTDLIGGGMTQNMLAGLMNAAELVNTNKDAKDADGNALYTEQELAQMASASFTNNLMYIPIDALSWGITYGQAGKKISSAMRKAIGGPSGTVGGMFTQQQALKNASLTMNNSTKPVLNALMRIARPALKGIPEGIEETFQETFEEWSKLRAKAKVDGTEAPEYLDFYFSKENEATRAVSMALGMLGGGSSEVANMMSHVDEQANQAFKLYDKNELLKNIASSADPELREAQTRAIDEMLINNKYHGDINNLEYVTGLKQKGIIDDVQYEELIEKVKHVEQAWENADAMNVIGKVAYTTSIIQQAQHMSNIETQKQILANKTALYAETLKGNPETLKTKTNEAQAHYDKQVQILEEAIAMEGAIQDAMVSGRKPVTKNKNFYGKDPKTGEEVIFDGLTAEKYSQLYEGNDEDILKAITSSNNAKRGAYGRLGDVLDTEGRKAYKATLEAVQGVKEKVIKPKAETTEDVEDVTPLEAISEEEFKAFREDGTVSPERIQDIANKLKTDPSGDSLSLNEKDMRVAKAKEIEEILKQDSKADENIKPETEETGKQKTPEGKDSSVEPETKTPDNGKADVETAFEGTKITQKKARPVHDGTKLKTETTINTIKGAEVKGLNDLIDKSIADGKTATEIVTALKQEGYAVDTNNDELTSYISLLITASPKVKTKDKTGKPSRIPEKSNSSSAIYFRDINSQEDMNTWVNSNVGVFERGVTAMNKATVLNGYLQKTFPGSNIRSYAIKNLSRAVGDKALGYATGSVAFIDQNSWEQDEVYMHEFSHIFYSHTNNEEFTKSIIAQARKDNPNLVKGIEKAYTDFLMVEMNRAIPELGLEKGDIIQKGLLVDLFKSVPESKLKNTDFKVSQNKDQDLINEEIFVTYLQGPLAKKFNKHFQPKNEPVRQIKSRKWWGAMKESTTPADAKYVSDKMDPNYVPFNVESVIHRYKTELKGPVDVVGRFSKGSVSDLEALGKAESVNQVKEKYYTAVENYNPKVKNPDGETQEALNDLLYDISVLAQNDKFADTGEQNDAEQVDIDQTGIDYDKTYENIQAKAGDLISSFIKTIQAKNRAEINALAEKNNITPRYEEGIYGDIQLRDFKSMLVSSAIETESPFEWMDTILNSHPDNILVTEFAKFLQVNRGQNKYPILRSMHLVFNNTVTYPVIKGFIDEFGNYTQGQALSRNEIGQVDWLVKLAPSRINQEEASAAYDRIMTDQASDKDYKMVLGAFANKFIFQEQIIKNDRVNFKGGQTDLKSFLDYYVKLNVAENPGIATEMISNIVSTSRANSSDAIVLGANDAKSIIKRTSSSKHLSNALSKKYNKINKDLLIGISRNDFIKKYANMSNAIANNIRKNNPTVLATENAYMGFVWDNYTNNGITPSLSMYVGDENQQNNKNISYKDTDAVSLHLTDVLSFLNSNESYSTSMNTFGDSKRRIVTQMKKYNMTSEKLGNQFKQEIATAYNIYASSTPGKLDPPIVSFAEYKQMIQQGIDNQIQFFNDNSNDLINVSSFRFMFNDNGMLTEEAQSQIASHEISSIINKTMIHELLTPSIPISSNIKRNKMNISPAMMLSPTMRIENVFVARNFQNGFETNDSGQYITEATAKKLADAGKGVIDLNYGFKLINYNVEKTNKKFNGKAVALKGYTTILKPDQSSPELQAIYDTLIERERRFDEWARKKGVKVSKAYNDGGYDYIAIASPLSAEKGHMFTEKQMELLQGTKDKAGMASIERLMSNTDEYHDLMDSFHYEGKEFVGFDGSNLGPQMRMDMQRKTSTVPVQLASGVLVGSSYLNATAEVESILNDYNEAIKQQAYEGVLKHVFELDKDGRLTDKIRDGADLAKFVLDGSNLEKINPQELMLLKLSIPSVYNPRLNEAIKNQVRNRLIENLNKLRGDGTIAQQKSEIGGYQAGVGTAENKKLQFYQPKEDGSMKPMEGILPSYMEENTRARKYHTTLSGFRNSLMRNKFEFGLTDEASIESFITDHTIIINGNPQYYTPGESVLVTRVPSSGPSFTGVMEVIAFDDTEASNIQIPSEFKSVIGSDDDGDQLFINKKSTKKNTAAYNSFLDKMMTRWLSAKMQTTLITPLDPSETVDAVITEINTELGRDGVDQVVPMGSDWAKRNHNNALGASQTIGIAFNDHRLYNGLAAYDTRLTTTINGVPQDATIELNGQFESAFEDTRPGPTSRIHKSNTLTQIVLDSANNSQAEALGLNKYTVGHAMILTNLGFDLKTVGLFLNQPIVKEYTKRISSKGNLYAETQSQNSVLFDMTDKLGRNIWKDTSTFFSMSFDNNSGENQFNALKLIKYLNGINTDLQIVNKVMKGHKTIDNDPSVTKNQGDAFEKLTSNLGPRSLQFAPEYKNNPEAKRYLESLRTTSDVMGAMSIIHNNSTNQFYNEMKVAFGGDMTDFQTRQISKQLQVYNEAKFLGINNTWSESQLEELIDPTNPSGVLQSYNRYVEALIEDTLKFNEDNSSTSDLDKNLFLAKALVISENTEGLVLRTDSLAKDSSLTAKEIKDMQDGFNSLPIELQEKLIVADLVTNEWKGVNSLLSFFGDTVLNRMNKNANQLNANQNSREADTEKLNNVRNIIINNEMNKTFPSFKTLRYSENKGEKRLKPESDASLERLTRKLIAENQGEAIRSLQKGANGIANPEMYFNLQRYDKTGNNIQEDERLFIKVQSYTENEKAKIVAKLKLKQPKNITTAQDSYTANEAIRNFLLAEGRITIVTAEEKASKNIDLIAIADNQITDDLNKNPLTQLVKKKVKTQRVGMPYRQDFQNFTGDQQMTEEQFIDAQAFKHPVAPHQKKALYYKYLKDKDIANAQLDDFTDEKIDNMDDEVLLNHYKEFGKKDIYAYSGIMVPIMLEINKRSMNEQMILTDRLEDGKDIGFLKSWLQTNNIDSNHPATQAAQKLLEEEFKSFTNEKKKYVRNINKVTEALWADKFGKVSSIDWINKLKRALQVLFTDRNKMYETLYGNIVETVNEVNYKDIPIRKIKLLSAKIIESKFQSGEITKAEYDFAKMFRNTVNELASHKGKKDFATNGFIPAVGMSRMESFSHRGILGAFANSQTEDKAVHDVVMTFHGKEMSFKEIEDFFRTSAPNNFNNIKDYITLKNKARKLLKKGLNEDGSRLEVSNIQNITMLGDGMIHRFSNDSFEIADDFISMDLNKALYDFVHSSLFVDGNDKFSGFLKLQSVVDGLLIHNEQKGFKNQNSFVRKVYKEGFLKASRAEDTPLDKATDFITKWNLRYILGWKALVLQHGVYAVGNIVVGKYHNIKNSGGKAWITGEKRYWGMGKDNPGSRKAVGVLDTLNILEFNVYDDVNMQKQGGIEKIFDDIAFMPMKRSENWIQGTQLLGLLTEEQWNRFDKFGQYIPGVEKISKQEVLKLEEEVKRSQGKGYNKTDQRMIQQYSWGRMIMQFSRFIPTMAYDRFAKEDINIYGQTNVGSLRQVGKTVRALWDGTMSPKQYAAHRNSLNEEQRKALDAGMRGMGITAVALALGVTLNIDTLNELSGDANYLINPDKMEWKMVPSPMRTIYNMIF